MRRMKVNPVWYPLFSAAKPAPQSRSTPEWPDSGGEERPSLTHGHFLPTLTFQPMS